MMIRALVIPPPSLALGGTFMEGNKAVTTTTTTHRHGGSRSSSSSRTKTKTKTKRLLNVVCSSSSSSSRNHPSIPKLKPFSRNLLERALKEPPLIQKAVNEISDYCTTLEGDDCYSCWRAYFELKDLEQVAPKEDLERTIVESNGLTALISSIHRSVSIYNLKKADEPGEAAMKKARPEEERGAHDHVPDGGLPKTSEEMEEEEEAKMVDSPHTRLLRVMGKYPAWYTPAPHHQTD